MKHKPMCKINMSCAVLHEDGICPGPYGKCDCGAELVPPEKKECCTTCSEYILEEGTYECNNPKCVGCHSLPQKDKRCGTDGKTMWCYCGNCKQEDYPLPKDLPSHDTQGWENEFREYFDKTLKSKEPTMKNLDRELCINFIKNLLSQEITKAREDEHQFFLNILNGIDQTDKEMGNEQGGTRAIRFALKSRYLGEDNK